MLIGTWNVNSLRARLPRVLELLGVHDPDVVCLQETKASADGLPVGELEAAGYRILSHCSGRWCGVAILVRAGARVADVRAGLPGEPNHDEARWIEADVGGVRVVSVYVPNGRAVATPQFGEKLDFLGVMAERVDELASAPLVLAGDFNVAPTDADVWDPAACHGGTHVTHWERDALREATAELELIDAYRHLHPQGPAFTWWDYRAGAFRRDLGMRLDMIFLTPDLTQRLEHCAVARELRKGPRPSDHAPVLAQLS